MRAFNYPEKEGRFYENDAAMLKELRLKLKKTKNHKMETTVKNYFSEVKKFGFENLPEALKKAHLMLMAKADMESDWSRVEKDKEFKKGLILAFEKLNEFIKNNKKDLPGFAGRNALPDGNFTAENSGLGSLQRKRKTSLGPGLSLISAYGREKDCKEKTEGLY